MNQLAQEPRQQYGTDKNTARVPNPFQLQLMALVQDKVDDPDDLIEQTVERLAVSYQRRNERQLTLVLSAYGKSWTQFQEFLGITPEARFVPSPREIPSLHQLPSRIKSEFTEQQLNWIDLFGWQMTEDELADAKHALAVSKLERLSDLVTEATADWTEEDFRKFLSGEDG